MRTVEIMRETTMTTRRNMLMLGITSLLIAASANAETLTVCGGDGELFGDGQPVNISLIVPDQGARLITDVTVDLVLDHPWVGDIRVILTHSGQSIDLINRPGAPASNFGCSGDDIQATFSDAAGPLAEDTCSLTPPALGGPLRPNQALAAFDLSTPDGFWTLSLLDLGFDDCGTLASGGVCIHITHEADCNTNGVPDPQDISGGQSDDDNQNGIPDECELPGDSDGDGDVDLTDYAAFYDCAAQSQQGPYDPPCAVFDFESDGDVDLADFRMFQLVFTH